MRLINRVPMAICALALGLAGLGNLLASYTPVAKVVCGVTAGVIVVLVLLRIVTDLPGVRAELSAPPALAVFPTLFMALMVLATYVKPFAPVPALGLWVAALVTQLAVVGFFAVRHVAGLKLAAVAPGWFVTSVGFVVASLTSPAFGMQALGSGLLVAGLLGYLLTLAVVVYRVATLGDVPAPLQPTNAIFLAPPSLCLAGYLAVTPAPNTSVVVGLLGAMALSLAYVLARVPRVLLGGFLPSLAALTFPFVIAATALRGAAAFFSAGGGAGVPAWVLGVSDGVAVLVVGYVLVRYAVFLLGGEPAGSPGRPHAHSVGEPAFAGAFIASSSNASAAVVQEDAIDQANGATS